MGTSKRSNYTQSNSGTDVARNLGIVVALLGMSFFLGFFVLGRMVPDKESSAGTSAAHQPSALSSSPRPLQIAQKSASPAVSEADPSAPESTRTKKFSKASDSSQSVVTIEPADEIAAQKPRDLDSAAKTVPSDGDNKEIPSSDDSSDTHVRKTKAVKATTVVKETPDPAPAVEEAPHNVAPPAHKPRKTRRSHKNSDTDSATVTAEAGLSDSDQKPSQIDPDSNSSESRDDSHSSHRTLKSSTRTATAKSNAKVDKDDPESSGEAAASSDASFAVPARRVRYRVDAGAYSRREAAEKVAQRVTDMGLEATVLSITKEDGTTAYRVQQGIYRKRSNADAAQKKLSDAGLDTGVVKTGG